MKKLRIVNRNLSEKGKCQKQTDTIATCLIGIRHTIADRIVHPPMKRMIFLMLKINKKDILIVVHVLVKVHVQSVNRMRIRATNLILNKLHNLLLARLLLSRPVT